jgi:MoaA/NifB/PqqE/SkfB family radical SAM enzyme
MYKVKSRWNHQDSIKIEWNIGKRCNYDCSYCPSVIHDNSSPHTDINILKATVDTLCDLEKPIRLSLTGGEPCVHPRIEELIAYISFVIDSNVIDIIDYVVVVDNNDIIDVNITIDVIVL